MVFFKDPLHGIQKPAPTRPHDGKCQNMLSIWYETFGTVMRRIVQNIGCQTRKANKQVLESSFRLTLVVLWQMPPRSPDLNPIEKFWGWLRCELRRRDFKDLQEKRAVLSKAAFRARVRAILRARKTQRAAARFASGLLGVCSEVKAKRGAASRG